MRTERPIPAYLKMDNHRHNWKLYSAFAEGYFSKRGEVLSHDQKLAVQWYAGEVHECANKPCGQYLFRPFQSGLADSECELDMVEDEA